MISQFQTCLLPNANRGTAVWSECGCPGSKLTRWQDLLQFQDGGNETCQLADGSLKGVPFHAYCCLSLAEQNFEESEVTIVEESPKTHYLTCPFAAQHILFLHLLWALHGHKSCNTFGVPYCCSPSWINLYWHHYHIQNIIKLYFSRICDVRIANTRYTLANCPHHRVKSHPVLEIETFQGFIVYVPN